MAVRVLIGVDLIKFNQNGITNVLSMPSCKIFGLCNRVIAHQLDGFAQF